MTNRRAYVLRDSAVHQRALLCEFDGAISRKSLINKTRRFPKKAPNRGGGVGSIHAGRATLILDVLRADFPQREPLAAGQRVDLRV